MRLLLCASVLAAGVGCAAAKSQFQILDAQADLAKAEEYGAGETAVYEHTMAESYLDKAREEHGFSEFKDAVDLAKASSEWSDKAIIVIQKGGVGRTTGLELEDKADEPDNPTDDETRL